MCVAFSYSFKNNKKLEAIYGYVFLGDFSKFNGN